MNVLIVAGHYTPEPVGMGVFTAGTAEAIAAAGHDVTVIAAKPHYPDWQIAEHWRKPRWQTVDEAGVRVLRCPLYVPPRPTGIRRIASQLSFAAGALLPLLRAARRHRPDIVFVAVPTLAAGWLAWLAARLHGARLWLHIQDFEVEAAVATGAISGDGVVARIAGRSERALLAAADRVSSISRVMCGKVADKGVAPARIVEFRNWADITRIAPLNRVSVFRDEWGLGDRTIAFYSGTIAKKQGIGLIVDAARLLTDRVDIVFLICGSGPGMDELRIQVKGLDNVITRPLQPAEKLGELLATADMFLLPQLAGMADLVLPSKLANMLAAGRPVIATAAPGTALATEVAGAGIVTAPGDAAQLAGAIAALADDPPRRVALGQVARERALERWDRKALLARFVADFEQAFHAP